MLITGALPVISIRFHDDTVSFYPAAALPPLLQHRPLSLGPLSSFSPTELLNRADRYVSLTLFFSMNVCVPRLFHEITGRPRLVCTAIATACTAAVSARLDLWGEAAWCVHTVRCTLCSMRMHSCLNTWLRENMRPSCLSARACGRACVQCVCVCGCTCDCQCQKPTGLMCAVMHV